MTVPFKVKAVYEYRSEEPDDLNFENGQIITVTEDDDPDWYTGDYTSSAGQKLEGIFPRNFVEKYEPAIPTRPARAPRKAPQPEPATEPEPSGIETKSFSPTAALPAAHEPSREAEIEPPKQFSEPTPAPKVEPQPPAVEEPKPMTSKKAPPPVVEKPSSFKDRIAAFNKPAAAPVAPFKPAATGQSFIKKPFVAPPPSRNAFVPPPREPPPPKVYRREEEPEMEEQEQEHMPPPAVVSERTTTEEGDQPKTETLKERIARLQAQQLENAQRQAESTKKKEKPKRPVKSRTESSDAVPEVEEEGAALERTSTERPRQDEEHRQSLEGQTVNTPPLPSRELVSDTNDADDSGAADTEDPQDLSTEEERPRPKSIKSPPTAVNDIPPEQEEAEEDTEDDEDPEIRRRRELRERMAKMSGGMGMMGMFGGGASAASAPKRAKSTREDRHPEPEQAEDVHRAPPVPIMALPGMAQHKSIPKPAPPIGSDEEFDSAIPTPQAHQEAAQPEEDYVSQRPSRRSTERSQPLSPRDRAPPPLPEARPEPLQSPGERPVPPPPPPTARAEVPPPLEPDDGDDGSIYAKPLPTAISRAVPPPPPIQLQAPPTQERAVPPIPMSPVSPQSRAAPPPPPGQQPPRRSTTQSSIVAPPRDDSEDEVTEYDGDYDTDIASSAKHKDARKTHHREASLEEGTLSDDTEDRTSTTRPAPPPIPNMAPRDAPHQRSRDSFDAPRAVPPPLPPTTARPRESLDVPRAAPPPVPPPQTAPRESVELPRTAPPPVPQSPVVNNDYDPYRYSQQSLGPVVADLRKATDEYNDDQEEAPEVPHHAPPLMERAAPSLPPQQAHMRQEPEPASMSGALAAPPGRSIELGRSNSRRSADVSRPSMDQGFIAADIDLAQSSMWWIRDNTPPPSLQNRADVLWEVESSTTQKRGGRSSVSRDIYVLYQDYSQSTINATYDSHEPTHVSFEQSHSRPPMPPRKDQLESASESFGLQIAKSAEKALGNTIGEGTAQEFVLSLIRPLQTALLPIGLRSYGALVYANLANASTQQHDEIRPGDIITFRGAKFAGHKGGLHQKYAQDVGAHVAVVVDWDGTKKKIRAWEQGVQEKGKKSKVREESYRVGDLKSGEVRVWRVMPRSWVNWGSG